MVAPWSRIFGKRHIAAVLQAKDQGSSSTQLVQSSAIFPHFLIVLCCVFSFDRANHQNWEEQDVQSSFFGLGGRVDD